MCKSEFFLLNSVTPNWKPGDDYPTEWRHFCLNLPIYTKFTSPIR